jgi:hypothetical protein
MILTIRDYVVPKMLPTLVGSITGYAIGQQVQRLAVKRFPKLENFPAALTFAMLGVRVCLMIPTQPLIALSLLILAAKISIMAIRALMSNNNAVDVGPPPPFLALHALPNGFQLPEGYFSHYETTVNDALKSVTQMPLLIGKGDLMKTVMSQLSKKIPMYRFVYKEVQKIMYRALTPSVITFLRNMKPVIYIDPTLVDSIHQNDLGEFKRMLGLFSSHGARFIFSCGSRDGLKQLDHIHEKQAQQILIQPLTQAQKLEALTMQLGSLREFYPSLQLSFEDGVAAAALFLAQKYCITDNALATARSIIDAYCSALNAQGAAVQVTVKSIAETTIRYCANSGAEIEQTAEEIIEKFREAQASPQMEEIPDSPFLPSFMTDLNRLSRRLTTPYKGVDEVVDAMRRSLSKYDTANCLLLGPAGCGKTSAVEELARRIEMGEIPEFKGYTVYRLDLSGLLATEGVTGQLETKLSEFKEFLRLKSGKAFIFCDELHRVVGAGMHRGRHQHVIIDEWLPLMTSQSTDVRLHLIGATTPHESEELRKIDPFMRRLDTIEMEQPPLSAMPGMVTPQLTTLIDHHRKRCRRNINVQPDVVAAAIYFVDKYLNQDLRLPMSTNLIDLALADIPWSSGTGSDVTIRVEEIAKALINKERKKFQGRTVADLVKEFTESQAGLA